jgi:hypothetical protein
MKKITLATMLMAFLLSSAGTCTSQEGPNPEGTGCFSNAPLENIAWAKSGPLQVSIYTYREENFLVFTNPSVSSPMSHIFDCSGANIGQRGINYNVFMDSAKEIALLLEGSY